MRDLTNPKLIYLKAALFLLLGTMCGTLLILESPSLKVGLLLAVTIWSFARCYYFAFYVIEKYVDPAFKFAGLWSLVVYWMKRNERS